MKTKVIFEIARQNWQLLVVTAVFAALAITVSPWIAVIPAIALISVILVVWSWARKSKNH